MRTTTRADDDEAFANDEELLAYIRGQFPGKSEAWVLNHARDFMAWLCVKHLGMRPEVAEELKDAMVDAPRPSRNRVRLHDRVVAIKPNRQRSRVRLDTAIIPFQPTFESRVRQAFAKVR